MLSFNLNVLVTLTTLSAFCNAYAMTHYTGLQCRGGGLGKADVNPTSGCQRGFAGNAASVVVKAADNDKDFGNAVVFFSGPDCNPKDIMNNGDGFSVDGCFTANYGSYEVWDLWKI